MTSALERGRPSDEQLARLAAAAASAVPGLIRLQPGLRHLAGRAARTLFTGADAHDDEGDRSGISVDRDQGDLHVTLRVVVATTPAPRLTATDVQAAVGRAVGEAWGAAVAVTVVIVDVEMSDVETRGVGM